MECAAARRSRHASATRLVGDGISHSISLVGSLLLAERTTPCEYFRPSHIGVVRLGEPERSVYANDVLPTLSDGTGVSSSGCCPFLRQLAAPSGHSQPPGHGLVPADVTSSDRQCSGTLIPGPRSDPLPLVDTRDERAV